MIFGKIFMLGLCKFFYSLRLDMFGGLLHLFRRVLQLAFLIGVNHSEKMLLSLAGGWHVVLFKVIFYFTIKRIFFQAPVPPVGAAEGLLGADVDVVGAGSEAGPAVLLFP